MDPEAPVPPEKPRTIDQYSTAELVGYAQRAAYDPEATPIKAARIVDNISTEFLRRSKMLAELRETKRAIEAKHAKGQALTEVEVEAWKNATLTLNEYANFDDHVVAVNGVRASLSSES